MPYVRDSFWRGREFTSLAADAGRGPGLVPRGRRAARTVVRWTGRRRWRCSPRSRPRRCKPLPRKPFVLATWSTGKIGPDIHVKVGKTLYSVPWRYIGQPRGRPRDPDRGADLPPRAS